MEKSPFQIIILVVSGVLIVVGVIVFALLGGRFSGSSSVGTVVIWGTQDQGAMQSALDSLRQNDSSFTNVSYVQKSASAYVSDLVNALAGGKGPDLFILPQDQALAFADKVALVPYSAVSQNAYTSSYIDEGNLFLTSQGALALPLAVDPLVMYWNRDLLSAAAIAQEPQYWNEVLADAPKLTSIDASSNVKKSAAALGLWSNIPNAKGILSALFMQAGDQIVITGQSGPEAIFGAQPSNAAENPAESALRFYTQFADPGKSVYSWNRSLPQAQTAFVGGTVGLYFGYGSEYQNLLALNPNIHIGVAMLPQAQGGATLTYGKMLGVAIARSTQNPSGALTIAKKLSDATGDAAVSAALGLPPARRDLLSNLPTDPVGNVLARSALIARGWLDPSPAATDQIFKQMVESVLSGQDTPADAVAAASQKFYALIGPAAINP